MPFIFPKRFLRTRDVLDPFEMSQDLQPLQELCDGELDRHNFNAADLKTNIKPDPFGAGSVNTPSVGPNAYYDFADAAVECQVNCGTYDARRRTPPNFVRTDGTTFRHYPSLDDGYPSIIPNSGEWSPVKTADLSGPMQATVTTGRANLWIVGYAQYVWQGFYEYKPPWRPRIFLGDGVSPPGIDFAKADIDYGGWSWWYNETNTTKKERNVLNSYGPSDDWKAWGSHARTTAESGDPVFRTAYYAYPLNEPRPKDERDQPNLGGYHHISRGFYPALVQFAIRVDGKIIEESITGRRFSFEESAHGLRIDDSAVLNKGEESEYVTGQRSAFLKMAYGTDRVIPGQKLRSSRAVSCGPEVLPVRIGAVVPVLPGDHTIELVARRLQRKRKKFEVGDFVGVFSRRIHAMSLPVLSKLTDAKSHILPVSAKNLQSEDPLSSSVIGGARDEFRDRLNGIDVNCIKPRSMPNTHLPSKVAFWDTTSISPQFEVETDRSARNAYPLDIIKAVYIPNSDEPTTATWRDYTGSGGFTSGGGWQKLTGTVSTATPDDPGASSTTTLEIVNSELSVGSSQRLLIMADVEVRGIEPLLSDLAKEVSNHPADDSDLWRDIGNYLVQDKYLDLFALFSIGYRTGTGTGSSLDWTIGRAHRPAVVNSFNWANRLAGYIPTHRHDTVHSKVYDTGAHDYSFRYDGVDVDRRGNQTGRNNLGITVPLMLAISVPTDITEVAVFGATTFPSDWDYREATWPEGDRMIKDWYGPGDHYTDRYAEYDWRSPVGGRPILDGVECHIGRCRLTAIKLLE